MIHSWATEPQGDMQGLEETIRRDKSQWCHGRISNTSVGWAKEHHNWICLLLHPLHCIREELLCILTATLTDRQSKEVVGGSNLSSILHGGRNDCQLLQSKWTFSSVQFSSVTQSCLTLCDPMDCSTPGSWSLLKLMSIESVMPSNHLIPCCPLFFPPSIFPSIRVFSNESVLRIRWPKDWSFSISPSNEYSGLISFRMDWLDLLAVQGTRKRRLQHHRSKASILWHSASFIVQLSYPYMTTEKTIALTRLLTKRTLAT